MKFLFLVCLALFAGCQVSLLPPTFPSQKYVLTVSKADLDFSPTDCLTARVYLSEIKVAEYLRSAKIRFEVYGDGGLDGEVRALDGFEWASSLESIFGPSYERGLRQAFEDIPEISFLNQASSAASDLEIGVSLIRIYIESDNNHSKVAGELSMRVFDIKTGKEDYFLLRAERPFSQVLSGGLEEETQIFSTIQDLISGLFQESYQTIGKRLCAKA